MSKLLGLWLRSSLIILNPCEIVRSQKKAMFMRVRMIAEEEIHRGVCECCANWANKRNNSYAGRKSREQLVKFQVACVAWRFKLFFEREWSGEAAKRSGEAAKRSGEAARNSVVSLPGSSRLWSLSSRFPRLKTAKLRRLNFRWIILFYSAVDVNIIILALGT